MTTMLAVFATIPLSLNSTDPTAVKADSAAAEASSEKNPPAVNMMP
jgi:hypothetical protein